MSTLFVSAVAFRHFLEANPTRKFQVYTGQDCPLGAFLQKGLHAASTRGPVSTDSELLPAWAQRFCAAMFATGKSLLTGAEALVLLNSAIKRAAA